MTQQLSDEKLVAYVVGELDKAELKAVEKALESDAAARQTVAELRATAKYSRQALLEWGPTDLKLSDAQREAIAAEAKASAPKSVTFRVTPHRMVKLSVPTLVKVGAWLAAASVLVVLAAVSMPRALERAGMQSAEIDRFPKTERTDLASRVPSPPLAEPAISASRIDEGHYYAPLANGAALREQEQVQALSSRLGQRQRGTGRTGGLQNVTVAGSIRPRADYYFGVAEGNEQPVLGKKGSMPQGAGGYGAGGYGGAGQERRPEWVDDASKNYWPGHNTEAYDRIVENPFRDAVQNPLSTFSIDVDTASYANVRRFLNQGTLPPPDAVRIEEMVNYFSYDYAPPDGDTPFSAHVEVAGCPWAPEHRLARVGLKGWEMAADERPASNLVFLLDVSGSMRPQNKLPLVKKAMRFLVKQLGPNDRVAIAVYANASGLVLPSTSCDDQRAVLQAIKRLESGGSTNGGEGIQLAYDVATQHFIDGGVNRVILATDGDFNVGVTNQGELVRLIEDKAKSGVFLTVLGFGMGNVKDSTLEKLADKGNGNYAYIDTFLEAKKVFGQQLGATLVTIAKDVKIQIEFNPAQVGAYRLIGYENRILAAEDFNDDTKDAGEIGAGHTVTALYELVPAGQEVDLPSVDPLRYQRQTRLTRAAGTDELFTLKLRYKDPDADVSQLLSFTIEDDGAPFAQASEDLKFAASVAGFGMILRQSEHKGTATLDGVLEIADEGLGDDRHGYRREFLDLVRKAKALS